jgi:hypothetical protein
MTIRRTASIAVLVAGALELGQPIQAQSMAAAWGLYVYPSAGQTAEQQTKDELQCKDWSKQMTGIDPANPAAQQGSGSVQSEQQSERSKSGEGLGAAQGAVRGAAAGALIGNLADKDASTWGWAGAVVGSVRGAGRRAQQSQAAEAQSKANAEAEGNERLESFKKAFTACMQGKKYTVN